jgi:glyoxylate/hydroxypyruvate/2-ketogluconate reductase
MQRAVVVTRRVPSSVLGRLREHFVVHENAEDVLLSKEALLDRARSVEAWGLFAFLTDQLDAEMLRSMPSVRIVANMAVGVNHVDLGAAKAHNIVVTNTPDVLTETTADLALALMLGVARRVTEAEQVLRAGQWQKWSFDFLAGADVHDAVVGVVGMGRIGAAIATRAHKGFRCRIRYHARRRVEPQLEAELGGAVYDADLDSLLRESDFVVLVLPYSRDTHHLVDARRLALMRPSAFLINVARGGIVDDVALARALQERHIAGAGLDVFEGEPRVAPELLACRNVVLLPHIGSATVKTRTAMANLAADNLIAFHKTGVPLNAV